jgi:hypothetical protein
VQNKRIASLCLSRLFFAILLFPAPMWGQTTDSTDQQSVSQLVKQIKDLQEHERGLEERIRVLEANQKPATPAETAASTPASEIQAVPTVAEVPAAPQTAPPPTAPSSSRPEEAQTAPPVLSPEFHNLRGIQWRGFGEVDYKVLNQRMPELATYGSEPGSAGNFYTGDFGLFLRARISEKTSAVAEIIFEEGDAQNYGNPDVRRILLNYDYNDHLRLSFGRYQTNIGYYNGQFRSAAWLLTTADRPLIMEYSKDGGPLPTQAVGVSVTGSIPSGRLGLHYVAEYGASDTIRPDVSGDGFSTDENNSNHINVGLFITPDRFPGLRIGGSYYHDQISNLTVNTATGLQVPLPTDSERWNQTIVNGHIVYVAHGVEFLNEGFLVRDAPIGPGEAFNTPAFYSQFSEKFGPVRPFFRYQYLNASPQNLIYDDIGLRYGPSFGARYDFNDYVAFKAQLNHTVRRGLPDINGLQLQLAFTF